MKFQLYVWFPSNKCPTVAITQGHVCVSARCPVLLCAANPLVPQFYPHCPSDVLSLPVWCLGVWEPSGGQLPWQFCLSDQTHPRCDFHNTEPKQTGGPRRLLDRVTTSLFSDSLHYNTFQNMPTALLSLPKPFRLLFGSVNIRSQHISTYLPQHISSKVVKRSNVIVTFWCLWNAACFLMSVLFMDSRRLIICLSSILCL